MYLVHIRNEYYFYSEHIKEFDLASVKIYEMRFILAQEVSGDGCGMCVRHTHGEWGEGRQGGEGRGRERKVQVIDKGKS